MRTAFFVLPLAIACASSPQPTTPPHSPQTSAPQTSAPQTSAPQASAPIPCVQDTPEPPLAALEPPPPPTPTTGRYWIRNGGCSALDVRRVSRWDTTELTEVVVHGPAGLRHATYVVGDGVLTFGGAQESTLALESYCRASHTPAFSGMSFAGVPLFEDRESCEAQECGDSCAAHFELGDCHAAASTSARRLRQVTQGEEASRQRTLARFQRIRRRGSLWLSGRSGCVAVVAHRDEAELELRYTEPAAGNGRAHTVANYTLAPLDLRAYPGRSTTTYTPDDGGVGGIGTSLGGGSIPLYFGSGLIVLGTSDLFFARAACEEHREAVGTAAME